MCLISGLVIHENQLISSRFWSLQWMAFRGPLRSHNKPLSGITWNFCCVGPLNKKNMSKRNGDHGVWSLLLSPTPLPFKIYLDVSQKSCRVSHCMREIVPILWVLACCAITRTKWPLLWMQFLHQDQWSTTLRVDSTPRNSVVFLLSISVSCGISVSQPFRNGVLTGLHSL